VLLLLDEPTSGVDIKTRDDILHLLADLNGDGITVVPDHPRTQFRGGPSAVGSCA